ncbi:MAG: type III pantothenate kinase [Ferruginibacter sp.]
MVTLCLDFGNTRLKAAIFDSNIFREEFSLKNDEVETIEEILKSYDPDRSILSSVIHHDNNFEKILSERTVFHKLTHTTKIPFSIPVNKKESIGTDRLALIAAAVHFFPGFNNLVIALGSCITYNFVNQYHQFLGGAISPGMDMRFKAMHDYTARLPLVGWEVESGKIPLIGYDTPTNLQSGVINGIVCELDGIINKYADKYGNFNVLLTGGNSAYFASQLKNKIFADSNFLFKGLYALSEINNCGD